MGADMTNWMSQLPNYAYVSQISIPGTHDSGTGNGFSGIWTLLGPSTAKTQHLSISDQLAAGVRALDLRPAVDGSSLPIYHGVCKTKIALDGAVKDCLAFLDAHPSEFIFIITRHETDGDDGNSNWAQLMSELMNGHDSRIVQFSPYMTVSEARGKLIVATRDSYDCAKTGQISGWGDNSSGRTARISCGGKTATLHLQDNYDCTGTDGLQKKKDAFDSMFSYSKKMCTSTSYVGHWVINHLSGYTKAASTSNNESMAEAMGAHMVTKMDMKGSSEGPTGIVMMDFAGASQTIVNDMSLVEKIAGNNFRYVPLTAPVDVSVTLDAPEIAVDRLLMGEAADFVTIRPGGDGCSSYGYKVRWWLFKSGATTPSEMQTGYSAMFVDKGTYSFVAAQTFDPMGNIPPSRLTFAHLGAEKVRVNNPVVLDACGNGIPSGFTWVAGMKARIKHTNILHGTDKIDFPTWIVGNREWKPISKEHYIHCEQDGDDWIWTADGEREEYTQTFYAQAKKTTGMADCFADSEPASYTFRVAKNLPDIILTTMDDPEGWLALEYPPDFVRPEGLKIEVAQYEMELSSARIERVMEPGETVSPYHKVMRARFIADGLEPGAFVYHASSKKHILKLPEVWLNGVKIKSGATVMEGDNVELRNVNISTGFGVGDLVGKISYTFEGDFNPDDVVEDPENGTVTFTVPAVGNVTRGAAKHRMNISCDPLDSRNEKQAFESSPKFPFILMVESDTPTGVENVVSAPAGTERIFTIDGVAVNDGNMCPGVYIVVRDGKAVKRIIRNSCR